VQALEVMLGLKMQKGPGGDEDMFQAAAAPEDSTADSKAQASAAAAAASSSGGGAQQWQEQQQQQQANGAAKVRSSACWHTSRPWAGGRHVPLCHDCTEADVCSITQKQYNSALLKHWQCLHTGMTWLASCMYGCLGGQKAGFVAAGWLFALVFTHMTCV
jgi:hypothetical protein